jgi:HD-like signal output (HDOD) protein
VTTADHGRQAALRRVERLRNLPTLSESGNRLLAAISRDHVDLSSLVSIIERDVALTARVLKVANSPYYGYDRAVDSAHRAVVILGVSVVRNVALASSLDPMFRGGRITPTFHLRELWQHSVAAAVLAEALAEQRAPALTALAFLGGLLHEVGWLVHLRHDPEGLSALVADCEAARFPSVIALRDEEIGRFGLCHEVLGGALLDHWRLPPALCEAVSDHHGGEGSAGPAPAESHDLAIIIADADQLTRQLGLGTCLEPYQVYDGAITPASLPLLLRARERLAAMSMLPQSLAPAAATP